MGEQTQFATHFHTFLRRAHFIIDENRAWQMKSHNKLRNLQKEH